MFDVSDEMIQARDSDSNYVWYGFTFDSVKKHTFSKIFSIAPLSSSRFGLQGCSFVVAMVAKKNYGVEVEFGEVVVLGVSTRIQTVSAGRIISRRKRLNMTRGGIRNTDCY
jgi:hypothetical protein